MKKKLKSDSPLRAATGSASSGVVLGTNDPRQIIINLLAASHPAVRDATDETLVAAFLDMEDADEEIRDTAQAVLEARKYIRESQLVDDVMAAIRACPDSAQLKHLPYGGYVIEDGGEQLGSGVTPTDAWLDAAIPPPTACSGAAPPPKKNDWSHSEQVLVYYAGNERACSRYSVAYYHYDPPFESEKWIDHSGSAYGRTPLWWWPLPSLPNAEPSRSAGAQG